MSAAVNQLIERTTFQRLYYAHTIATHACASTRLVSHDMMLIAGSLWRAAPELGLLGIPIQYPRSDPTQWD
jgi:hypothetical protein